MLYLIEVELKKRIGIKRDNLRLRINRDSMDTVYAFLMKSTVDEAHGLLDLELQEHLPSFYGMSVVFDESVPYPIIEPRVLKLRKVTG